MDDSLPLHPAIRGLKTVCRCNNIKYRTIERAILKGARSVADVAKKTGATTGHCGGSCTPEIQEMLADLAPAAAKTGPAESRGSRNASFPVESRGSRDASFPAESRGSRDASFPAESRDSVSTSFPVESGISMTASPATGSVAPQTQGSGAANADAQPWWVRKK